MHRMGNQGRCVFVDINIPWAHLLGRDLRLRDVKAKANKLFAEEQIFRWLWTAGIRVVPWGLMFSPSGLYYEDCLWVQHCYKNELQLDNISYINGESFAWTSENERTYFIWNVF
jgi:hypothetical protein